MPEGALLWGLVGLVVLTVSGAAGYYFGHAAILRKAQSAEVEIGLQRQEAQTESADLLFKATKESFAIAQHCRDRSARAATRDPAS